MRPRPPNRSLSKALDTKILSLVRQFVSEQSSDSPTLQLRLSAILTYVSGDPALTRHKKPVLEKSIQRALDVILDEGKEDDGDEEAGELDDEFEGLELMLPDEKESNAVNRRITEMWGIAGASEPATPAASTPRNEKQPTVEQVVGAGGVSVPAPPLQPPGSPKRKRKDRGEDPRAKRQKGIRSFVPPPCGKEADPWTEQRRRRVASRPRICC
jgi:ribosome biogenesis ATPase